VKGPSGRERERESGQRLSVYGQPTDGSDFGTGFS
jgi:hypothetical protein